MYFVNKFWFYYFRMIWLVFVRKNWGWFLLMYKLGLLNVFLGSKFGLCDIDDGSYYNGSLVFWVGGEFWKFE